MKKYRILHVAEYCPVKGHVWKIKNMFHTSVEAKRCVAAEGLVDEKNNYQYTTYVPETSHKLLIRVLNTAKRLNFYRIHEDEFGAKAFGNAATKLHEAIQKYEEKK